MSESQGGAGRREVAYRLFATEFDDADFSYSESDEERAPNYVVTPTGARVNRLFVVGVLTEVETVSEDYLRARVVDPTGPFVIYAGQYQPDALAFLERAAPPTFVAVTGKARTYQPDDSDQVFTSIRPESINEVDAATRDQWVVQTAEQTLGRVARTAEAKQSGLVGDALREALLAHGVDDGLAAGIPVALEHYGTTGEYLAAVREVALDSARVVAGDVDEAESLTVAPGQGDDEGVDALVERVIDVDAVETAGESVTDAVEEPGEVSGAADVTAESDTGNGSAIGTAASSNQDATAASVETARDADSDAEDGADVDTEADGSTVDAAARRSSGEAPSDEPADESTAADRTEAVDADTDSTPDEVDGEPTTADGTETESDDLENFEPEFDLDEEKREQIEEEHGTEFQTGSEVDEPGEADIQAPEPTESHEPDDLDESAETEELAETGEPEERDPSPEETDEQPSSADEATDDDEATDADDADEGLTEPTADVDLEDAVVDAMTDLDEGDGADREEVIAAVVDRSGATPDEVEDAIQDALMSGRCYEPDDATLKPI